MKKAILDFLSSLGIIGQLSSAGTPVENDQVVDKLAAEIETATADAVTEAIAKVQADAKAANDALVAQLAESQKQMAEMQAKQTELAAATVAALTSNNTPKTTAMTEGKFNNAGEIATEFEGDAQFRMDLTILNNCLALGSITKAKATVMLEKAKEACKARLGA